MEAKTHDSSWVLSLAAQPRCLSDSINKSTVRAYLRLVPKAIRTNLMYSQNETYTTFPTTTSLSFTTVCCCFCSDSQRALFKVSLLLTECKLSTRMWVFLFANVAISMQFGLSSTRK